MSEETLEHSEEKEEQKLPSKHIDKEELSDFAALLSELPDEAAPILEGLPDKERRIITRAMVQMSVRRSWEGPLPDPETLRGYNGCFEGGAKAVFDLTKDQSDHRKKLETTVVNRELNQSGRGQNYAFILALVLMGLSGFLAYIGEAAIAGVFISVDVIGLAAVFIAGKYGIKMDLRRKKKQEKDEENE